MTTVPTIEAGGTPPAATIRPPAEPLYRVRWTESGATRTSGYAVLSEIHDQIRNLLSGLRMAILITGIVVLAEDDADVTAEVAGDLLDPVELGWLEHRAQIVRGLRELAQFLAMHPEVPVPRFPCLSTCVSVTGDDEAGRTVVRQAAAALEVEPYWRGHQLLAERKFGAIAYEIYTVVDPAQPAATATNNYVGLVQP